MSGKKNKQARKAAALAQKQQPTRTTKREKTLWIITGTVAFALGVLLTLALTSKDSGTPDTTANPTPTAAANPTPSAAPSSSATPSSTPKPPTKAELAKPAIFEFEQDVPDGVTAMMMIYTGQTIVFKPKSESTVTKWTVTSDVPGAVEFTPGTNANNLVTNPGVKILKTGNIVLTVTDGTKSYKLNVYSSDPGTPTN